jgi:hypothetical protein
MRALIQYDDEPASRQYRKFRIAATGNRVPP